MIGAALGPGAEHRDWSPAAHVVGATNRRCSRILKFPIMKGQRASLGASGGMGMLLPIDRTSTRIHASATSGKRSRHMRRCPCTTPSSKGPQLSRRQFHPTTSITAVTARAAGIHAATTTSSIDTRTVSALFHRRYVELELARR